MIKVLIMLLLLSGTSFAASLEARKIDDRAIEVTKEAVVQDAQVVKYDRQFVIDQIKQITLQRDEMIALKEKELKECEDILAKMDELGVVKEDAVATSEAVAVSEINVSHK